MYVYLRHLRKRWQPMLILVLIVTLVLGFWGVDHFAEISISLMAEQVLHLTIQAAED